MQYTPPTYAEKLARSRAVTRPILPADIGATSEDLDLGLVFDTNTRTYHRR